MRKGGGGMEIRKHPPVYSLGLDEPPPAYPKQFVKFGGSPIKASVGDICVELSRIEHPLCPRPCLPGQR